MRSVFVSVLMFLLILTGAIAASSKPLLAVAEVPHGVVSIAFDDNYISQYTNAYPLMQSRNMVGTFYVVTDNIGLPGYMDFTHLQNLANSGNEIGSHSKSHANFISLPESQIRDECNLSQQVLQTRGFAATNFAYPNGLTNSFVDSIVDDYYRSGRTAYVSPYIMEVPTNQFRLAGFSSENSSALSSLKAMVDQVYSTNSWAIIFFHKIVPDANWQLYETSPEDFASFLDYVNFKRVQVLTVNQVLESTPLSIGANYGTVSPSSGLYTAGQTIEIEAFPPTSGIGERYVWLGWSGSGDGSYSGTNNPVTLSLNGPVSQTASWRLEYKLSISANVGSTSPSVGENWFGAGSNVNLQSSAPPVGVGERYVWGGWSGAGSGSYSGSSASTSIVMNGPVTEEASWVHQFYVNVSSSYGVVNGDGWFDSGGTTVVSAESGAVNLSSDVRVVFAGWGGGASGSGLVSDVLVIDEPLSAEALWEKQFLVVFDQSGLPETLGPNILVDSVNYALPCSVWVDEGSLIHFVYPDEKLADPWSRYVLTAPQLAQSPIEVNSPINLTAQYGLQYRSEVFLTLSFVVIMIIVGLICSVLLYRRRKSHS